MLLALALSGAPAMGQSNDYKKHPLRATPNREIVTTRILTLHLFMRATFIGIR